MSGLPVAFFCFFGAGLAAEFCPMASSTMRRITTPNGLPAAVAGSAPGNARVEQDGATVEEGAGCGAAAAVGATCAGSGSAAAGTLVGGSAAGASKGAEEPAPALRAAGSIVTVGAPPGAPAADDVPGAKSVRPGNVGLALAPPPIIAIMPLIRACCIMAFIMLGSIGG